MFRTLLNRLRPIVCCECGTTSGLVQWSSGRCEQHVCRACAWQFDYPFYVNQTEFP